MERTIANILKLHSMRKLKREEERSYDFSDPDKSVSYDNLKYQFLII